jgi:hypothetical protein
MIMKTIQKELKILGSFVKGYADKQKSRFFVYINVKLELTSIATAG